MKKRYEKPVVLASNKAEAHRSACGLTSYGGCGKLVVKNV